MTRAINLADRRANHIDRDSILLGAVRAGEGAAAETRTGAARVLGSKLNSQDVFKVVLVPGAGAAGGYLVEVAHVPYGTTTPDANWVTLGVIEVDGTREIEAAFSGLEAGEQVRDAASLAATVEPRVCAIRLTAGNGSNGTTAPSNVSCVYVSPVV